MFELTSVKENEPPDNISTSHVKSFENDNNNGGFVVSNARGIRYKLLLKLHHLSISELASKAFRALKGFLSVFV